LFFNYSLVDTLYCSERGNKPSTRIRLSYWTWSWRFKT